MSSLKGPFSATFKLQDCEALDLFKASRAVAEGEAFTLRLALAPAPAPAGAAGPAFPGAGAARVLQLRFRPASGDNLGKNVPLIAIPNLAEIAPGGAKAGAGPVHYFAVAQVRCAVLAGSAPHILRRPGWCAGWPDGVRRGRVHCCPRGVGRHSCTALPCCSSNTSRLSFPGR